MPQGIIRDSASGQSTGFKSVEGERGAKTETGTLHIPEEGLAESCHSEALPKRDRPQYTFVVLLQLMSFQCTESDSYLDCKNSSILTQKETKLSQTGVIT